MTYEIVPLGDYFLLHSGNLPKFEELQLNLDNYLHSPGAPFLPDFGCAGSLNDAIVGFLAGFVARHGSEECFENGYGTWMASDW